MWGACTVEVLTITRQRDVERVEGVPGEDSVNVEPAILRAMLTRPWRKAEDIRRTRMILQLKRCCSRRTA